MCSKREAAVLTPKHVQSFRTAFNIAHALFDTLDIASWRALLAAVARLDVVLASHATTSRNVAPSSALARGSVAGGAKTPQSSVGDAGRDADLAVLEAVAGQLIAGTGAGRLPATLLVMEVLQEVSVVNGVLTKVRDAPGLKL